MSLKPVPVSGRSKVTSFIIITMNLVLNSKMPKEETFPIPLKYTYVKRSTDTDLDVMQEKLVDDWWSVDSHRSLSDSWQGFTKFIYRKRKILEDMCGFKWDWQKFKRLPDQILYGLKCVRKMSKAAQNREKQGWAKKKPTLEDWEEFTLSVQMTKSTKKLSNMRGESWIDLWLQPCRAKDYPVASRKWLRSWKLHPIIPKQYMVVWWNLMNPRRNERNLRSPAWRSHRRRRDSPRRATTWCTSSSRCRKQWKFRMQKAAVDEE